MYNLRTALEAAERSTGETIEAMVVGQHDNAHYNVIRQGSRPLMKTPFDPPRQGGFRQDDSRWVDPTQTREKSSHPYSYDAYFLWGNRDTVKGAEAVYSDRIWQWDREKADRCWATHQMDGWQRAHAKKASGFMSDYLGRPVKVVAIAEGCNVSNGYPYWIIWFRPNPAESSAHSPSNASAGNPATDTVNTPEGER